MMDSIPYRGAAFALAAMCSTYALAQPSLPRAHPADPSATAPAPAYRSAFEGYRPFRDEAPLPWRGANEEVARIGGHLGMFGGAAAATPPTAAPGSTVKPQAVTPHHHHGGRR